MKIEEAVIRESNSYSMLVYFCQFVNDHSTDTVYGHSYNGASSSTSIVPHQCPSLSASSLPSSTSVPSTFIKLPKYDKANVRAWVRHCSLISNFDLKMLFSKMPTEIINKFSEDDIDNSISYDSFKDILLPKVEESVEVSLTRLLEHEELGDRKPSTFLEHLVNLADRAGQDRDSNLIRQKFIQSMPSEIKVPLSALVSTPLKELADAADKMWATL